ncbi:MAG: oligosaccharide flippase family protein [Clostridia bacterium]|nr:oligosaccharide flippase family protein [Clostridia bacterium]
MSRLKKLVSNTFVIGVGTFASKLLVFLLMPFYTAWLSTSDFGAAELITSVANFLIPVACVGLSTGIFRFAAERESDREAVFSSSLALLCISLAAFLALSPLLLLIEYVRRYVWLIVLYVICADLQAICAHYLRAIDRTPLFAAQGVLNTLLTVGCNVLFLYAFRMGLTGYVLSVVVGNVLTTAFIFVKARLWRMIKPVKVDRTMMKALLRFSLPLIPTTLCWLITDLSDRTMVTAICGASANGIYSAAYKIPTLVTLVASIFLQAWQFSAIAEEGDETERKSFYSSVFGGYLSLVMIGAAGLILLSRWLTGILLADSYLAAWQYMPTLLCAAALEAIVSFLASVYLVKKKSMHSFLTALVGAVSNILLNLCLIPWMGPLGAAIATLASYALVMIARLWDTQRLLRFRLYLPRLIVGVVLLFALCAVMTVQTLDGRIWWALALTAAMVALNAPSLIKALIRLLRARRKA